MVLNQQNSDKNYNQNSYQNQLESSLYADFLPRVLAWLLDSLILTLAKTVLVIFTGLVMVFTNLLFTNLLSISEIYNNCNSFLLMDSSNPTTPIFSEQLLPQDEEECVQTIGNLVSRTGLLFISLTAVFSTITEWLYYAFSESSKWQASPGKFILGLKVVDVRFQKISFARASGRYFAKLLSTFCLGIGYLMPLFTQKKQALHDLVTNCAIVKKM